MEDLFNDTRAALEPLISKPKLSDKLLNKPPFRFIHDVISNVRAATGFPEGLYEGPELDSGSIKDKGSKIAFLEKIISCVENCTGETIDVRPAKIVAGLEPECTNALLQQFGKVAGDSSINWNLAIQKTLNGGDANDASSESKQSDDTNIAVESKQQDQERAVSAEKERAHADEKASSADDEDGKPVEIPTFDRPPTRQSTGGRRGSGGNATDGLDFATDAKEDTNAPAENSSEKQRLCNGNAENTKKLIEPIISKPKMASKLLSKPPFRFLHDTITNIQNATGYAPGLYSEEEQDSSNVKSKQSKMDYLQKIMDCVAFHLEVEITARTNKIVAGLEAENTNQFLQYLAVAATSGSDGSAAVQRVLSGESNARPSSQLSTGRREKPEAKAEEKTPEPVAPLPVAKEEPREEAAKAPSKVPDNAKNDEENDDDDDDDAQELDLGAKKDEEPRRTSRPTTARRRPPKLKENARELNQAPTQVAAPSGIMQDGDNEESDDDDEQQPQDDAKFADTDNLDGAKHGKLVRDILQDQSKQIKSDSKAEAKAEEDAKKGSGIRLGKRRKSTNDNSMGGFSANDVNQLRSSIQRLCQATNPLGKCLEYVHEDMESMSRELDTWRSEYQKKCEIYDDERKKTEESLQPLSNQLVEVEERTKEQLQKINSVKAAIAKNDDRIQKLLRMVVSS